jgi:hypothetical protein
MIGRGRADSGVALRLASFVAAISSTCPALRDAVARPAATQQERSEGPLPAPILENLRWLLGSWSSVELGVRTEERWQVRGGMMFGVNRRSVQGRPVELESLRIVSKKGGDVVYVASPHRQETTAFRLERLTASAVAFANPKHDFPQRIIYRREGNKLTARIEGRVGNKTRSAEWIWVRDAPPRKSVAGP